MPSSSVLDVALLSYGLLMFDTHKANMVVSYTSTYNSATMLEYDRCGAGGGGRGADGRSTLLSVLFCSSLYSSLCYQCCFCSSLY